jgi:hypothetical protein
MRLLLLLGALWVLPLPAQQLIDARNDNASYGNYAVGWPSSVIAFRFTATATTNLAAAQVFTGNQTPATHSLEIRTRNATTGLPDQLLGQAGSWTSTHARCWQGAVFALPAPVQAGQDYFLVWRVQGMFPQHSVSADTEPANVLVETRYSDGNTWHASGQVPAKFRLFVPHGSGSIGYFGTGKAGVYGVPSIGVSGWPARGAPIDVWLDDAARNVPAVLVLGVPIPSGVSIGWATIWATPDILLLLQTKSHTSPFVGAISQSFFIPDDPSFAGFPLTFQWGVFDAAALDGFSHTGGATATIL